MQVGWVPAVRRLFSLVVSSALAWPVGIPSGVAATAWLLASAGTVSAHCPGTAGYAYAQSGRFVTGTGIKASIEWTNPNPCTTPAGNAQSAEYMNISHLNASNQTDGWVQVGWLDHQAYVEPKLYCEFHAIGGTHTLWTWPSQLTHVTHAYMVSYDSVDRVWDCFLDGSPKFSRTTGFGSGGWLVAAGETDAVHGQIGENAPGKLLFSSMQYRNTSVQWVTFDPNTPSVVSPYGEDEPALGKFENWTNAH